MINTVITKSERREKKRQKARYGMKIDGRSVMTIQEIIQRKAEQAREKDGRQRD